MKILKLSEHKEKDIIKEVCKTLSDGGTVIYPTETSYGIGVDATNPKAVDKLMDYKEKREGKALSIIMADLEMAQQWVEINDIAKNIYTNFLPGPITVISKGKQKVDPRVESDNKTQGVRIPKFDLILKISQSYQKPFTATSANMSGKKTPYSIQDIFDNISKRQQNLIDLIIDAGELPHNPPSTVVDTVLNEYQIVRQGVIQFKSEKVLETERVEDTINFGKSLTEKILNDLDQKFVIFALQGELGAGKTQFTKGVAQALGIEENIISPTFTISREYIHNKGKLIHIDAYRLETEDEANSLGFQNFCSNGNVIVIEWVDKILDFLKSIEEKYYQNCKLVWIKIEHVSPEKRKITYEI